MSLTGELATVGGEAPSETPKGGAFGGKWKKKSPASPPAALASSAVVAHVTADEPRQSSSVIAVSTGGAQVNGKLDVVEQRRDDEQKMLMKQLEMYQRLASAGQLPKIPHPLAGKGSRMVFQQMTGVQKQALQVLGQEAYEGITEPWMAVVNSRTSGDGNAADGFMQPPSPLIPSGIIGKKLAQVSGGLNHSIACTNSGSVFVMGENRYGQLGVHKSDSLSKEKQAALAFLEETYGDPDAQAEVVEGEEGASNVELFSSPILVKRLQGRRVFHVGCGTNYSAALTDCGEIYTWGCNENGQLGVGDFINRKSPSPVSALMATPYKAGIVVVDLDCGADHMGCISFSAEVVT